VNWLRKAWLWLWTGIVLPDPAEERIAALKHYWTDLKE
jgi:hypothetical protein